MSSCVVLAQKHWPVSQTVSRSNWQSGPSCTLKHTRRTRKHTKTGMSSLLCDSSDHREHLCSGVELLRQTVSDIPVSPADLSFILAQMTCILQDYFKQMKYFLCLDVMSLFIHTTIKVHPLSQL